MGQTGYVETWVSLWWAEPCSVSLYFSCLLKVGLCSLLVRCFSWGNPVLESTSSMVGLLVNCKRIYANTDFQGLLILVPFPLQQNSVDLNLCKRTSNIHRKVWFSLLWGPCSFPLSLISHKVLLFSYKCLFPPVLWKSFNQIPLAFKVRFPGDS